MRGAFVFGIAMVLAAVGCGGGGGASGSLTGPSSAGGSVNVMLQDSPFSDAKALLVTFSDVSVHASGGDFVKVPFAGGAATRTCDLKKLTSASDVLGTGPMNPGHYTGIRLTVTKAVVYLSNPATGTACATSIPAPGGDSADVTIPSGELHLNREFDVSGTAATTILLDFDGDQSVKQTGNGQYMMTPVISVVSVQ
jgi:uncharacterized protein DUF4382